MKISEVSRQLIIKGAFFLFLLLVMFGLEEFRTFSLIDPAVTAWLQSITPRVLDTPLSFFSLLGSFEATSVLLLLLSVIWLLKKRKIPWAFILFGVILAVEMAGKLFVYHPSPPSHFFRYSIPFIFPSSYVRTNYSFPSGHTGRTFFLVVVALFLAKKFLKPKYIPLITLILVFLAAAMAVSRIYLGEHWTSDVIGGIFLGIGLADISLAFL